MSLWTWGRSVANPRRTWTLLGAVTLGLFVVMLVACMMPLYSSLMAEGYLQHILSLSSPTNLNLEIDANTLGITPAVASGATTPTTGVGDFLATHITSGSMTYLESQTNLRFDTVNGTDPVASGALPGPSDEATALGFDMAQVATDMRIIAGRLPQDTPADQPYEVLITTQMSELRELRVGDALALSVVGADELTVGASVVGIWTPKDSGDPFWNGRSFDEIKPNVQDTPPSPAIFPLLFTKNGFVSAMQFTSAVQGSRVIGPVGMMVHTIDYTDPARITPESAPTVIDDIKALRNLITTQVQGSLGVTAAALITNLDTILEGVVSQTAQVGLPFDIVAVPILGLTLLFVIAVTGILVERQAPQIATRRSRGASLLQVVRGYGLQGLVLAVLAALPAMLLAPQVALAVVLRLLPAGGSGTAIERQYLAQLASLQGSLLPAALGGALGLAALLFAVIRAARGVGKTILGAGTQSARDAGYVVGARLAEANTVDALQQGRDLAHLDRDADAIPYFEQAVTQDPDSVEAWILLSNSRSALRNFATADQAADEALRLNPQSVEALSAKADALGGLKRYQPALAMVDQALALNPASPVALTTKGKILGDIGQLDAAIELFDEALRNDPLYYFALTSKCRLLAYAGRKQEALTLGRSAVNLNPQSILTQTVLCLVLSLAGDFSEAMEVARRVTAQSRRDPRGWMAQAAVHSDKGELGPSYRAWAHAASLNPGNPDLRQIANNVRREMRGRR